MSKAGLLRFVGEGAEARLALFLRACFSESDLLRPGNEDAEL